MVSFCDVFVFWLLLSGNDFGIIFVNNIIVLVFFLVKYILFILRFKKEKKDILIFIIIKKNNIRIMWRFMICFKFFSKLCCMYCVMRL